MGPMEEERRGRDLLALRLTIASRRGVTSAQPSL